MKKTHARRATVAAGLVGAAAVTAAGLGAGNAAAFGNTVKLPASGLTKTVGGVTVKASLYDEVVTYSRPITTLPSLRDVWASGKIKVSATGGSVSGGKIISGYLVGCQVNFGASAEGDAEFGAGSDYMGGLPKNAQGDQTGPTGVTKFTLGPGTTQKVYLIDNQSSDGSHDYGNTFTGNNAGIAYSQQEFSYDGCAGYAQAKAFVTVKVVTDSSTANLTFYGKPFSLG